MDLHERLAAIIEPVLEDMGYELVRVLVQGNRRQTLQIMADRADGKSMNVDDCVAISRALSAVLDVEDPIPEAYSLEVSSPGIDRPLTRTKDFANWAGFEARIEAKGLVDGRKRFAGRLLGIDDKDVVTLDCEGQVLAVPFDMISKAKLVLADDLIAAVTAASGSDNDNEVDDAEAES